MQWPGKDFLKLLIEWEIMIAEYQVASGDRVSEPVRVAMMMDHAPELVKTTLCQAPLDQRSTANALKNWIGGARNALPRIFEGQVPVQVSAACDHGGKGMGRNGEGNGKGKNKDEGKSKENPRPGPIQFQYKSSHCSTWSNIRLECRQRLVQQAKRGTDAKRTNPRPKRHMRSSQRG